MTLQPSVLPHVVRESSARPSVDDGVPEKSTHQTPPPYQAVTSWRSGSVETPPRPDTTSPGEAVPFPPIRKTCTVQPRSPLGSVPRTPASGSSGSDGFGLT